MTRLASLVMMMVMVGALSLAACGESDEDEVRSVVRAFVVETDPAACERMTTAFVNRVWGDVEGCRTSLERNEQTRKVRVGQVVVDGDKATATALSPSGLRVTYEFVKQDDEWMLGGLGQARSKEPEEKVAKPKIQTGLDARGTVEAYFQAIEDGDGAALCGLFSRRYARKIREGFETAHPISDCVEGLRDYDWSKPRKQAKGVRVVDVSISGDQATVTLSTGTRVLLKQNEGRWVINDIQQG